MNMAEYVVDADECDQQPYGERDKETSPESKVGEQLLKSPVRTNQTGNVKGVSRIQEGKSLIMTIAWSGKSKRSHTMWVFKFYTAFVEKCVMPVSCCYELSSPRK